MSKIFINYRRSDSAGYAGRLYDRLVKHFGADHLFMDIDQIEPGEDFVEVLQKKLQAVQVAVVLIGKSWLDSKDETGQRRLDNPDDWVRIEIATLLERKIRIIPVLIGGAATPKSSQLPELLISLARRQAFEISDTRFHSDVDKLIQALEKIIQLQLTQLPPKPNLITPDSSIPDDVRHQKLTDAQHSPAQSRSESASVNKKPRSTISRFVMITIGCIALVFTVLSIVKLPITAQHDSSRDRISSPAPNSVVSESIQLNSEPVASASTEESVPAAGQQDSNRDGISTSPPERVATVATEQHAEPAVSTRSEESELASMYDFEPQMVRISPGSFIMGSPESEAGRSADEGPQHPVKITYPFEIGRYEVTFAQYDAFAKDTQHQLPDDRGWGRGDRPVINVTWHDAQAYVKWLSDKTGKKYRLPTEAEWEYVARAGTATAYWWGDRIGKANAACDGCGSQWDGKKTTLVGSFKPNAFGVYDTAGNVWEWTQDCWYGDYTRAPTDGSAWLEQNGGDCSRRVVRGGSWSSYPQ
ncbi:MAG TPA: SUMF1/EgtB/PvdO family nonheme iron enzyme [Nitrosomonas sp.]|nr:SUMF1/EgtB/PvdO family nonheme iron enzyme [Nitrosomonas sp.]